VLWGIVLVAGWSMCWLVAVGPERARADTMVTLEGVTFADGGAASGYFELNTYGYMEAADITTSPGSSLLGNALAGYTYLLGGASVPNGPAPFDSVFYFNSTVDAFSLILIAEFPVTEGGVDPLVVGTGSGGSLSGSNEYCTEGSGACGGASFQDGRLATRGILFAPEPGTLSLVGVGGMLLLLVRRLLDSELLAGRLLVRLRLACSRRGAA
jgi:hypothetical protein